MAKWYIVFPTSKFSQNEQFVELSPRGAARISNLLGRSTWMRDQRIRLVLALVLMCFVVLTGTVQAAPPAGWPDTITVTPPTASGLTNRTLTWNDSIEQYNYTLGSFSWSLTDTTSPGEFTTGDATKLSYHNLTTAFWSTTQNITDVDNYTSSVLGSNINGWGTAGFLLPYSEGAQAPEPASLLILLPSLAVLLFMRRSRSTTGAMSSLPS